MIVGDFGVALMSDNSLLNHSASCEAVLSATYSASAVDNATTGYFLLNQLIAPPDMPNIFPVVECRSSMSPAQSALRIQLGYLSSVDLSYLNPRLIVPLR